MIVSEYTLSPCIFDRSAYKDMTICDVYLKNLKNTLFYEQAFIRNLYDGKWISYVNKLPTKHSNTKYILQSLKQYLRPVKPARANNPGSLEDWFEEAMASYQDEAYDGIIATAKTVNEIRTKIQNPSFLDLIASIENLEKADWWKNRRSSIEIKRQTQDYLAHLNILLNHANSLIFIDPYFNPNRPEYQEFKQILEAINKSDDPPSIEVHLSHLDTGITMADFERLFRTCLETCIKSNNLIVNVFIWDKMHDRYILTNLMGIHSGHSFSISCDPNETTTWTRIDRQRRDELLMEFNRNNSRVHKLQHSFTVS